MAPGQAQGHSVGPSNLLPLSTTKTSLGPPSLQWMASKQLTPNESEWHLTKVSGFSSVVSRLFAT